MSPRVIMLHPDAPPKPAAGAPCNGCGVCCATAPCPLGMWISKQRQGECRALTFEPAGQRYRCGVIVVPGRWLPWLPAALARGLTRRWIAAAQGCDSDLQAVKPPAGGASPRRTRRRAGPPVPPPAPPP